MHWNPFNVIAWFNLGSTIYVFAMAGLWFGIGYYVFCRILFYAIRKIWEFRNGLLQ